MSALEAGRCPDWCAGHAFHTDFFDGSRQVTHQRPVVASHEVSADLEWYEDLRPPSDPEYFENPPTLVVTGGELGTQLVLPITPETLDLLSRAVEAARLTLLNPPPPITPEAVELLARAVEAARLTLLNAHESRA